MNIKFPHLYLEETESTNLVAFELLSKTKPPDGFLIITDYQTAGKGQYGRNWQSERAKNLLCSVILGPLNLDLSNLFRLHLASSLALIRSLNNWELDPLCIKWPNDIYVGPKKLAGILIQNQLKGTSVEWSVIGIGMNVNQTNFPVELNATSLQLETGMQTDRIALVGNIRSEINDIISQSADITWDLLLEEYNLNLYLKDQLVKVTPNNGNSFIGKINSVTKEGKLQIEISTNEYVEFAFGEIRYEMKTAN